ncbi:MAG: ATP-binding protein [Rubripirellula sp.]|nr:ATP-binding protein [Rubripirellula sp.]
MEPIHFLEAKGFVCFDAVQYRGPIAQCLVKLNDSPQVMSAQWLEQRSCGPELYNRVRRLWSRSERSQPMGALRQNFFHDADQRLIRVISTPVGRPMSEWLLSRQFDVDESLRTAISLVECLQSWHSAKLVRGWLSSETVFRDADQQVELADLSLLGMNDQQEILSLPVEDLVFLPPETIGSLPRNICPASDLYSVGAILFSMLAGRPPIEAESASDYLDRQLCNEPSRLRELQLSVPRELDSLVARLLRRDPRDRYATASALLYDLRQIRAMELAGPTSKLFAIGTQDIRLSLTEGSLVGREQEIHAAQSWIEEVTGGNAGVQYLTGCDPNARCDVMDEISLMASSQRLVICRGTAAAGASKPLQSLESVLAGIDQLCEDDEDLADQICSGLTSHAITLSKLLPALSKRWTHNENSAGPEAYGSRRVAASLEELFVVLARRSKGVVLLFDELDHADELTQTVVGRLIDRIHRTTDPMRLGVIASGADRSSLSESDAIAEIKLGKVSDLALHLSLCSSAGQISKPIVQSIIEIAEGNLEKASAILGRMIDTHVVRSSPEGWEVAGDLQDALRGDESFADLLDGQVKSLTSAAKQVLSTAAVMGQEFDLFMLASVAERPYAEVLAVSTDAVGRRLLRRHSEAGLYCFTHAQIHGCLCDALPPEEQRQVHLKSAAYLEKQKPLNLFALSFHYDAADRGDLALQTALDAAAQARSRFALLVAKDQLEIAKRWVNTSDRLAGLQIIEGLAEIDLLLGNYDDAAVHLKEALRLTHLPTERAAVKQQMGELAFKRGQFTQAASEYEEALKLTGVRLPTNFGTMILSLMVQGAIQAVHTYLPTCFVGRKGPPSPLDCLRWRLMSRLSHVYWFSRDKLWTLANHLRSLNLAERFEPSEILAAVYSEHGPVMSLLRWFKRANRYMNRSLAIRKEQGDFWGQGQSLHYHSVVSLAECRFEDAIRRGSRAVELLRQTGDLWEMNMCRYQVANAFLRIGNLDEATETASTMYYSGREIGDQQAAGISLDVWARSAPESLPLEVVIEEANRNRPDAQSHAQTQLAHAIVLLHHQRIEDAIERLQAAIERCRRAGHLNTYISPLYAWLATAMRRQLESTDPRDGRLFHQRLKALKKSAARATRVARSFPADRAHSLREQALVRLICGNVSRARRLAVQSMLVARRYGQPLEEYETLIILKSIHQRYEDLIGKLPGEIVSRIDCLSEIQGIARDQNLMTKRSSTGLSVADRFATVLQSGRRIAQGLEPDAIYKEASESARRLLRGNGVDVIQIEGYEEERKYEPYQPMDAHQAAARIDAFLPLLEDAVASGQSVSDSTANSQHTSRGSVIATPIAYRGTPIAIILVVHDELKNLFGEEELRIADFVSSLAGAALENADGFRRLQLLNDTLEEKVRERTQAAEQRAQELTASNEQLLETEEQLRKAIDHANSANRAKSRFLATISHEIRTPLNGILGMTRLAQQSVVHRRQANFLDTVQESGQSLLTLINDLLDVSKLEAGKLEIEHVSVQLHELIGETCRLMSASAWQKDVELVCDIDVSVPEQILSDPSRLRQIMMNLIGNAIKFTEHGFVAVTARVVTDNDQKQLMLSVQDSGIGIAVEKQSKVFDSFSQADSSTTRRYGGSGLGLAICRELAELMGGTLGLESELGVGSEFSLVLPLESESVAQPTKNLSGSRIAVIDSLPASCQAIASALMGADASVSQFATKAELEAQFDQQHFDCAVFGIELDAVLYERLRVAGTQCMLLIPPTASWESIPGEAIAELRKPALSGEIVAVVESLLRGEGRSAQRSLSSESVASHEPKGETALPATDPSTKQAAAEEESGPLAGIRVLVAEDGAINREVISGILEMLGCSVSMAVDGVEVTSMAVEQRFDICLMDVDMPVRDGIEATYEIRKLDHGSDRLPIVAMTAHCSDQIWIRCQDAGMDGFLSKPVEPKCLMEVIQRYVAARDGMQLPGTIASSLEAI